MSKNKEKSHEQVNSLTPRQLHQKHWEENNKIRMAASEMYDKYLLTLSSGFLGGVITIIRLVSTGDKSLEYAFAKSALAFFVLTIILTLISLLLSFLALDKSDQQARRYYLEDDECAYNEKNCYTTTIRVIRWVSFSTFISGVLLLAIFTLTNLQG